MFSKTTKSERLDSETREQYEYARARIKQKKNLMRHFILFLVGSILFIILNVVLHIGEEILIKNWFVWAILIWAFLFLIHLFNVFIMNTFMGREWEDRQMEKLKAKQVKRINELEKKLSAQMPLRPERSNEIHKSTNSTYEEKKSDNPNLLPPEEA
ncbi:MAG: 2TM domain-containing protein [Flavobacteriaceae bacterium]|nr:2TM domain-containing protein [Flavobacteriaceae bacterium]